MGRAVRIKSLAYFISTVMNLYRKDKNKEKEARIDPLKHRYKIEVQTSRKDQNKLA